MERAFLAGAAATEAFVVFALAVAARFERTFGTEAVLAAVRFAGAFVAADLVAAVLAAAARAGAFLAGAFLAATGFFAGFFAGAFAIWVKPFFLFCLKVVCLPVYKVAICVRYPAVAP
jgi:hypothetical protein